MSDKTSEIIIFGKTVATGLSADLLMLGIVLALVGVGYMIWKG